jgi:hypothetical protein
MRLGFVLPLPLADAREMADGTRMLGYLLPVKRRAQKQG